MLHCPTRQSSRCHSLLICCAWLALAGAAQAQEAVFTPQHVAKLRMVTQAEIAPDGSRVAYVLSVPRTPLKDDDGPAWAELHVVNAEGESRPFVSGQVNVSAVAWRPGADELSFLAKRGKDEHTGLYVIPVAGGESRRVIEHKADLSGYSWSPDGKRVAFLAAEPLDKQKKELRDKGFNQQVYEEDYQRVRVWLATPEQKDSSPRALELTGSATDVRWSPAGDQLAVVIAPTPLIDDTMMNKKVHLVDVASGNAIAMLDTPGKLGQVAWSPDGKQLAVISAADRNDPQEGRLWIGSLADGKIRDASTKLEAHVTSIAWRDKETVAFLVDSRWASHLGNAHRHGTDWELKWIEGQSIMSGLTVSSDGSASAWIGHTDKHPAELFLQRPGEKQPRRLTRSNAWLDQMRFAKQQVVQYKARDGLELDGILIRPLAEQPGTRYPLILTVHGGPESHVSNGWVTSYSNPGQMAAARGFAVFYPNYRGSTGRGVAFSKLGQADAAGKEFDDLVDAVDHLVNTGLVDRAKVGITGGSYGGYASAWGATRYSDRFAASVMFVGLSDNVSKSGTTDIPQEMYLVHHRKRPWEDWKYFLERSPIYYADKSHTPLLILHGKDDPRVHPSQSLELYRHIKLHGQAPVRLVLYPGEGHGNRRSGSRLDYNLRMLQWMEHYLQGPGGSPPPYEIDYASEMK